MILSLKFVVVPFSICSDGSRRKADPSTSLRFGRDDLFDVANFQLRTHWRDSFQFFFIFLLFFEDGASLLVGCDDAGEFLDFGGFFRGKGDLATVLGPGVFYDIL